MHVSHLHHPLAPTGEVRDFGRILIGLVAIAIGVLYLLDSAGSLDAGQAIDHTWPSVIIAIGLFQLAERSRPLAGPLTVTAIGVVLLLITTHAVDSEAWSYVWPAAIILGGIVIIARWKGVGTLRRGPTGDEVVLSSGIFGGSTVASASKAFRGASLTAIFGGVTLDLREAELAPEGASITATAAFGGIDILVPRGWRIVMSATPIFGGAEDKTAHDPGLAAGAPVLKVDVLAVFGGLEVKHKK